MLSHLVFGKTLGLVGLGQIGQAVARRARGFSMTVLACDPHAPPEAGRELGVEMVPLERVLRDSDFVSLHCTLCGETEYLIGERELSDMKSTAFLINAGRGKLVDQAALTTALRERWIAGAALDVLAEEPPDPGDPLLQLDNVVFTPHCSSFTLDTIIKVNQRVCANVLEAVSGLQPAFLVNPDVWPPGG